MSGCIFSLITAMRAPLQGEAHVDPGQENVMADAALTHLVMHLLHLLGTFVTNLYTYFERAACIYRARSS